MVFKLIKDKIMTFRDFYIYFLRDYGTKDKINEKNKEPKRERIEWFTFQSYEQKVLELVVKYMNIDHNMSDLVLVRRIQVLLPVTMQRNVAAENVYTMEEMLS